MYSPSYHINMFLHLLLVIKTCSPALIPLVAADVEMTGRANRQNNFESTREPQCLYFSGSHPTFLFTFSHLADTFIQNDLQIRNITAIYHPRTNKTCSASMPSFKCTTEAQVN